MIPITTPLSFDRASEQVESMIYRGEAFARVEDAIDGARLSQRHKAALWLLAWSLRDPASQRRDARLMAGAFARDRRRGQRLRLCPELDAFTAGSAAPAPLRAADVDLMQQPLP